MAAGQRQTVRANMRPKVRVVPEGEMPVVDCAGSAAEVGRALGYIWRDTLQMSALRAPADTKPWWTRTGCKKLVNKLAPYLPQLYENMAKYAGVPLWATAVDMHNDDIAEPDGCTSFAITPSHTLDGVPISGQTKDNSLTRAYQFQVLRLRFNDGTPDHLSLTYPGWLFGHGFVRGGCSIFRNTIYNENPGNGLPFSVFGLLALHCKTVGEVVKLVKDHGVRMCFHITVADEHGGVVGIENTAYGAFVLKPKQGIYTHANCIFGSKKACAVEGSSEHFARPDSLHRTSRLRELLAEKGKRLTAQEAMYALADRIGSPRGISRTENNTIITSACIVAQPTKGLLHVTRGSAAENWPVTYSL